MLRRVLHNPATIEQRALASRILELMCGIAGSITKLPRDGASALTEKMTQLLLHRGPDAGGLFVAEANGKRIALGHRRLSILDLSPTGAQPMHSRSERFTLSFNGEIYNHLTLRKELSSYSFRGTSDTETLLAGFEKWGLEETLKRSAGMFALALWDNQEKKLFLARDRMGEKPLYYGHAGDDFLFASELKAFRAHESFRRDVNSEALETFLRLGYIPAPLTIFENVKKLLPGHWLEVSPEGKASPPHCFWSLVETAERGLRNPVRASHAEEEIESLLKLVLSEQKVADVPLGCFLSGGIDSSLISAMLAETGKLKTYSIGFPGGFDESSFAREVAQAIGAEHTELRATAEDALALVPELPQIYDEPFADVSQIPTLLLTRLARKHVTVALSGDGGDEIFAGYNRYLFLEKARSLPGAASGALRLASLVSGSAPFRAMERTLRLPQIDEKLRKLASVAGAPASEAYWSVASQGLLPPKALSRVEELSKGFQGVPSLQLRDQLLYLPDDILVKVDRAAMAASLETRAPYLDHRLVELAWRLPLECRIRGNSGKIILRRLLEKRLDPKLWSRPKAGFSPPIGTWLNGPLRDWADDLLAEKSISNLPGGGEVRSEWLRLRGGSSNSLIRLWPALMAQAWLKSAL